MKTISENLVNSGLFPVFDQKTHGTSLNPGQVRELSFPIFIATVRVTVEIEQNFTMDPSVNFSLNKSQFIRSFNFSIWFGQPS